VNALPVERVRDAELTKRHGLAGSYREYGVGGGRRQRHRSVHSAI